MLKEMFYAMLLLLMAFCWWLENRKPPPGASPQPVGRVSQVDNFHEDPEERQAFWDYCANNPIVGDRADG